MPSGFVNATNPVLHHITCRYRVLQCRNPAANPLRSTFSSQISPSSSCTLNGISTPGCVAGVTTIAILDNSFRTPPVLESIYHLINAVQLLYRCEHQRSFCIDTIAYSVLVDRQVLCTNARWRQVWLQWLMLHGLKFSDLGIISYYLARLGNVNRSLCYKTTSGSDGGVLSLLL